VDVKKASIHPDERLRDKLQAEVEKLIVELGKRGRQRASETQEVTLRLDGVNDVINRRLQEKAAKPAPHARKGKDASPEAKGQDAADRDVKLPDDEPPAPKGETNGEPAPAATPRIRFGAADLDDEKQLYRSVEKGGNWLIELNTRHPTVRYVSEAKHKFVTDLMSSMCLAIAMTAQEVKHGQEFVDKLGVLMADLLGA
jgi:hypothetical protein